MISGPQCRAARALVESSRELLAKRSGVTELIIEQFERSIELPGPAAVTSLQSALEDLGAVFISENGGGVGVRLKFSRTETKRISRLEGEGGIVASDEVP
ncbi:hypothetical protein SAMN05518861_13828 [Mesorhizobium sp. YR577]|nr:hypothetical protein [Mesorhizobium sp. YR577]SFU22662.1 hypothetical protein SAMN05518861_13828 [Mesorhizobium sp. YR577]